MSFGVNYIVKGGENGMVGCKVVVLVFGVVFEVKCSCFWFWSCYLDVFFEVFEYVNLILVDFWIVIVKFFLNVVVFCVFLLENYVVDG